jgi:hypothetical protein
VREQGETEAERGEEKLRELRERGAGSWAGRSGELEPDAGMAGCTGKKKRREEQRTALVSRGEEIRPSVRGERRRNLHRR